MAIRVGNKPDLPLPSFMMVSVCGCRATPRRRGPSYRNANEVPLEVDVPDEDFAVIAAGGGEHAVR